MNLACTRGDAHEYQDKDTGRKYFSCSQVLSVLDPDAFASVPPDVLEAAGKRGELLHVLFGLLLLSRLNLCEKPACPDGELAGYFDAMEKFIADPALLPLPVRVEESSANESLRYAGTPDCLLDMREGLTLIDLKTGGKRAVHKTQLVGYHKMDGYAEAKKLATLYVHADGTYQLDYVKKADHAMHWAWFQAGLAVLKGRRMHHVKEERKGL